MDPLHNELDPNSLGARDLKSLLHPSTNLRQIAAEGPVVQARAEGVYVYDEDGRQLLEGMAGLWCTAIGFGEEELADVAREQMKKLSYAHLFGGKTNEASIALAEKLLEIVPMPASRVFFGLSGSDANDTQVKLMWYYHNLIGKPERKKIISRIQGYHGTTVAAGSLTGLAPFHAHFDLPIPNILHTDSPHYYRLAQGGESEDQFTDRLAANLEAMIQAEGPETVAAFIAEPVMGAGGVVVPPDGYYQKIQAVLDRHGIFFIDDEVITGFGRTGQPFGAQTFDIRPTTMSIAKALSSAYLPISGVIVPEFMVDAFRAASPEVGNFAHGFTYSGHPVCAAVALRNLELIEERSIFDHAARMSVPFQERLARLGDHPLVGNTRGVGLIGAFELVADKETKQPFGKEVAAGAHLMQCAFEAGLVVRALGDSIAICPPLVISELEIDELFSKIDIALAQTAEHLARAA